MSRSPKLTKKQKTDLIARFVSGDRDMESWRKIYPDVSLASIAGLLNTLKNREKRGEAIAPKLHPIPVKVISRGPEKLCCFEIPDQREAIVSMPLGARPLAVDCEISQLVVWALVPDVLKMNEHHVPYRFRVCRGGEVLPPAYGTPMGVVHVATLPPGAPAAAGVSQPGIRPFTEPRFIFFVGREEEQFQIFDDKWARAWFIRKDDGKLRLKIKVNPNGPGFEISDETINGEYHPGNTVHLGGWFGQRMAAEIVVSLVKDQKIPPEGIRWAREFLHQYPLGPQIPE